MQSVLALIVLLTGMTAFAENTSVYTSIAEQDCRITQDSRWEKKPEIDFQTRFCAGVGGYSVKISGGDLRYSLSLIANGKEVSLTRIYRFHEPAASKIEWRGNSLIYRMNIANEDGVDSQYMMVVRLAGRASCLIGVVPQGADMNVQARAIADNPAARCRSKSVE